MNGNVEAPSCRREFITFNPSYNGAILRSSGKNPDLFRQGALLCLVIVRYWCVVRRIRVEILTLLLLRRRRSFIAAKIHIRHQLELQ